MSRITLAAAIAATFVAPTTGLAQDAAELENIKQQIRQLEERLKQTGSAPTPQQNPPAYGQKPLVPETAFNPAISLIVDGKYRNLEKDPAGYQIGGFIPGGEETGPGDRGFGIDESELTISANIDPYFSGYFTAAVTGENEVEIEEVFIQNSGALPGVSLKFGRYFSAFGYQNEQHAHVWDFVDLPLVHQAFFGGQLADDGLQLRYVAPTPLFLEFGLEGGRGASFPGSDRNKNGFGGGGAFVHLGGDVGASNSYRVGASYRKASAVDRQYEDVDSGSTPVVNAFAGDSKLWGIDLVWKWAPDGDPSVRNFKFQAEYMQREETGDLTFDLTGASAVPGGPGPVSDSYRSRQKGWYLQAVYQFMPRWRIGGRYEQLDSGSVDIGLVTNATLTAEDFPVLAEHKPKRASAMVDFSPSEFSRVRVQLAQDEARFAEKDTQIFVQYVMSLGAHGAHKF
jgi:hypothetical protein